MKKKSIKTLRLEKETITILNNAASTIKGGSLCIHISGSCRRDGCDGSVSH